MAAYTFVIVLAGGADIKRTYVAENEEEARRACWEALNNNTRDAVESVECVKCDERGFAS